MSQSDNERVAHEFYASFARKDATGMNACYTPEATFSDPVFPALRGREVTAMWEMLCKNARDLEVTHRVVSATNDEVRVHWEAVYSFSKTGRKVHNVILAELRFKGGKIVSHIDRFDFYRMQGVQRIQRDMGNGGGFGYWGVGASRAGALTTSTPESFGKGERKAPRMRTAAAAGKVLGDSVLCLPHGTLILDLDGKALTGDVGFHLKRNPRRGRHAERIAHDPLLSDLHALLQGGLMSTHVFTLEGVEPDLGLHVARGLSTRQTSRRFVNPVDDTHAHGSRRVIDFTLEVSGPDADAAFVGLVILRAEENARRGALGAEAEMRRCNPDCAHVMIIDSKMRTDVSELLGPICDGHAYGVQEATAAARFCKRPDGQFIVHEGS